MITAHISSRISPSALRHDPSPGARTYIYVLTFNFQYPEGSHHIWWWTIRSQALGTQSIFTTQGFWRAVHYVRMWVKTAVRAVGSAVRLTLNQVRSVGNCWPLEGGNIVLRRKLVWFLYQKHRSKCTPETGDCKGSGKFRCQDLD